MILFLSQRVKKTPLHEKLQHGYNTLFLPIEYYSKDGPLLINSDIVLTGSG